METQTPAGAARKRQLAPAGDAMQIAAPPAAAALEAPSTAAPSRVGLRHDQIARSALNPRRIFNRQALDELKESMAARGQLQELKVRPANAATAIIEDGRDPAQLYEIIIGERRWRAAGELIKEDRWPAELALRCTVELVDDRTALAMASAENIGRDDLHPIEEAWSIEKLRGFKMPDDQIMRELGLSERTFFRRVALLRLDESVSRALIEGRIDLQEAGAFTVGDKAVQAALLKKLPKSADAWGRRPEQIRAALTGSLPSARHALFDLKLYTGDWREDPEDEDAPALFADLAQFQKLQLAEIDRRVKLAEKKFPWVDQVKTSDAAHRYGWPVSAAERKASGCVVVVPADLRQIQFLEQRLRPGQKVAEPGSGKSGSGAKSKVKKPTRYLTEAQLRHLKEAKTRAMARGVAGNHKLAIAAACLGLLGAAEVQIERSGFHPGQGPATARGNDPWLKDRITALLPAGFAPPKGGRWWQDAAGSKAAAEQMRPLLAMKDAALADLFAALVARDVGSWMVNYGKGYELGDSPLACLVAETGGAAAHLAETFAITPDYLAAFGKGALVRIGQAVGMTAWGEEKRDYMVKCLIKEKGLPALARAAPEARFASSAEIVAAFEKATLPNGSKRAAPPPPARSKPRPGTRQGALARSTSRKPSPTPGGRGARK